MPSSLMIRNAKKGDIIHDDSTHCTGQLRAHILSDEGREITIYRLFDRDMCLLSASCIMHSIRPDH